MKQAFLIATAIFTLAATTLHAAVEEHYEEESIKIPKARFSEKDKQVTFRVGEKTTFEFAIRQADFFGRTSIAIHAHVGNTTKQKMKAVYSISFHDKDGKLVGCTQAYVDVDAGDEKRIIGNNVITLDAKSLASVTRYKLRTLVVKSKTD